MIPLPIILIIACCVAALVWMLARNLRAQTALSLTQCPACQGQISVAANQCPHCGQPLRRGKRLLYAVKLVFVVIFALLAFWLVSSTACSVYRTHLDSSGHFVH